MSDQTQEQQNPDGTNARAQLDSWRTRLYAQAGEIGPRSRALVERGNRSRLVVEMDGRKLIDLPLTAVIGLGVVGVFSSPAAVVVAAVAAALCRVEARVES